MDFQDPITGYHAGSRRILEDIVHRNLKMVWSTEDREWLGHGVYFWASYGHAERWVNIGYQQGWWGSDGPAILAADISLRNCLNLTDTSSTPYMDAAAQQVQAICYSLGVPVPQNERMIDGVPVENKLDCAIINQVHQNQHLKGQPSFDTVIHAFSSGAQYLPGSTFRKEAHIQLAVRNHSCISKPRVVWTP